MMKKLIIIFSFFLFLSFRLFLTFCQEDCANCKIYRINTNITPPEAENLSLPQEQEYYGEYLDAVDEKSETDN